LTSNLHSVDYIFQSPISKKKSKKKRREKQTYFSFFVVMTEKGISKIKELGIMSVSIPTTGKGPENTPS
jgi:hypothetical protein